MAVDNKLIFDEQAVKNAYDPLNRLMRMIFFRTKVDAETFKRKHLAYFNTHLAHVTNNPEAYSISRSNTKNAINTDRVTWASFVKTVCDILGLDVVKIEITLRSRETKHIITVATDDPIDITAPNILDVPPPDDTKTVA